VDLPVSHFQLNQADVISVIQRWTEKSPNLKIIGIPQRLISEVIGY